MVRFIKRTRPQVDDLIVLNSSGRWYKVTEVFTDYRGWWDCVEAQSLDTDIYNVFWKGEFRIAYQPRVGA
jgi:hypothetical protein